MSRRRGNTNSVAVIYWRDIPAQVSVGARSGGHKILLDARFQHAIDRAAVVAGKTDTEGYVAEWRRIGQPLVGDPDEAARSRAEQLDADYPKDRLEALVRSGGVDPAFPIEATPTVAIPTEAITPDARDDRS